MGILTNLLLTTGGLGVMVTLMHPVKGASFFDAFRIGAMTAGLSFVVWGSAIAIFK